MLSVSGCCDVNRTRFGACCDVVSQRCAIVLCDFLACVEARGQHALEILFLCLVCVWMHVCACTCPVFCVFCVGACTCVRRVRSLCSLCLVRAGVCMCVGEPRSHNVVVAVGGYSTQTGMLDTAEVFDPSNPEAGWVQSMLSLIFVAIFFN